MFEKWYRSNLESEVDSKECKEALERIKKEHPVFDRYPTVESLRNLLDPNNKSYADKDEVLTVLLNELRQSNSVYPLINLMFWKSLHRLYRQRRSRVDDTEELFSRIQWEFYEVVTSHDTERLPRKIDVNIFLNTKKRVIAWEKENIREDEAVIELSQLEEAGLSPSDLEASPVPPEEIEAYLLDMVYRKVITKTQYDILIDTLVFKRMNHREWAEKHGMNYHTVRNLRTRAEYAIRRFERESRASTSHPAFKL